jgi:asparagine synthase (glutamine-hydrolysing)
MIQKLDAGKHLSETDDMALAGILSSQLVYQQFVKDFTMPEPLSINDDIKVCVSRSKDGK